MLVHEATRDASYKGERMNRSKWVPCNDRCSLELLDHCNKIKGHDGDHRDSLTKRTWPNKKDDNDTYQDNPDHSHVGGG